jgi:hypothetical protein
MVESSLHLSLKEAVKLHHAGGNHCWTEAVQGYGGEGSLRVDVKFVKNHRYYLYECEIRPNIKRLKEKGRKRSKLHRKTVYSLVVPESEYSKRDWRQLAGFFDIVYAFNVGEDRFTGSQDLRTFGGLQDLVLDFVMPVVRSRWFVSARRWIYRNKNHGVGCVYCLLGKRCPLCWSSDDQCIFYKLIWGNMDQYWEY